LHQSYRKRISK